MPSYKSVFKLVFWMSKSNVFSREYYTGIILIWCKIFYFPINPFMVKYVMNVQFLVVEEKLFQFVSLMSESTIFSFRDFGSNTLMIIPWTFYSSKNCLLSVLWIVRFQSQPKRLRVQHPDRLQQDSIFPHVLCKVFHKKTIWTSFIDFQI